MVFELTPSGSRYTESVLYRFCQAPKCSDGKTPSAGVIFDTNGALYGTTTSGSDENRGVVFELKRSGSGYTESALYSFCRAPNCADGATPSAGLIFDRKGALYGEAANGGAHGAGTVFKLTPSGSGYTESVLYSFCSESDCTDGAHPYAGLTFDQHGALYGTTTYGALSTCYEHSGGCGTVFRLTPLTRAYPSGTRYKESVLYAFCHNLIVCGDGTYPAGGVIFDKSGTLYGATSGGGKYFQEGYGGGLIFELVPSGSHYKYRVPYYFGPTKSFHPNTTPVFGNNGALFGTSTGYIDPFATNQGTVWELAHVH